MVAILNLNRSRSCGCWKREKVAADNRRLKPAQLTQHGLHRHELYQTWATILKRCDNPSFPAYRNYGGRGITVCDDWRDVRRFVAYVEEHLGPRPVGHSIDRIDNDGHYEPGNIRWATPRQQAANRRRRAA